MDDKGRQAPEADSRIGAALDGIAGNTSRRGFIARLGGALMAATAGTMVGRAIEPGEADAYHFCGHIYTTGSCVHPTRATPRIDADGWPLDAASGGPIDNIGRRINKQGNPVNANGDILRDPDGRPLPPAPRTKVCDETARIYNINAQIDGSWYRCCGGRVGRGGPGHARPRPGQDRLARHRPRHLRTVRRHA